MTMSNVHLFFLLLLLPFHEECSASHSPQKLFFQSVSSGPIVDTVYGKVRQGDLVATQGCRHLCGFGDVSPHPFIASL